MIFNVRRTIFPALLLSCSALGQERPLSTIDVGGVTVSRPLILRSDFVAKDVLRTFMIRSEFSTSEKMARFIGNHPGVGRDWFDLDYVKDCIRFLKGEISAAPTPRLKGGKHLPVAEGFDRFGGSRYPADAVILKKRVHFWEKEFASTSQNPDGYRKAMQRFVSQDVAKRPEFYKGKFSDEYIEKCVLKVNAGSYVKTNPITASGEMCEFHHNVATKEIAVISQRNHRLVDSLPSKGHGSGTKFAGGGDLTWAQVPLKRNVWASTALRWSGMAGVDLLLSSAAMFSSNARNKNDYIVNAGSVTAAYLSATVTESLIVNAFSLSAGTTPAWFGRIAVGAGGFASWIASGVYFAMRTAVMYGWKMYQLEQAIRVEKACRASETALRRSSISAAIQENSRILEEIVGR